MTDKQSPRPVQSEAFEADGSPAKVGEIYMTKDQARHFICQRLAVGIERISMSKTTYYRNGYGDMVANKTEAYGRNQYTGEKCTFLIKLSDVEIIIDTILGNPQRDKFD